MKSTNQLKPLRDWILLHQTTLIAAIMLFSWAVIIGVATYDNFETVKNKDVLAEMEQNPVASWVLDNSDNGVALVVAWKTLGLGISVLLATWIWRSTRFRKHVVIASGVVAIFQLYVLNYLLSDYPWRSSPQFAQVGVESPHDGLQAFGGDYGTEELGPNELVPRHVPELPTIARNEKYQPVLPIRNRVLTAAELIQGIQSSRRPHTHRQDVRSLDSHAWVEEVEAESMGECGLKTSASTARDVLIISKGQPDRSRSRARMSLQVSPGHEFRSHESIQGADHYFRDHDWKNAALSYQAIVQKNDSDCRSWFRLGYALHMMGDLDEAIVAHRKASQFTNSVLKPVALYNLACAYSLKGELDTALNWLDRAVGAGFRDASTIQKDLDLEAIRSEKKYLEIIARL